MPTECQKNTQIMPKMLQKKVRRILSRNPIEFSKNHNQIRPHNKFDFITSQTLLFRPSILLLMTSRLVFNCAIVSHNFHQSRIFVMQQLRQNQQLKKLLLSVNLSVSLLQIITQLPTVLMTAKFCLVSLLKNITVVQRFYKRGG